MESFLGLGALGFCQKQKHRCDFFLTANNLRLMNVSQNKTQILLEVPPPHFMKCVFPFDSNTRQVPMWQTVASGNSFTFWRKFQPHINKLQATQYTDVSNW